MVVVCAVCIDSCRADVNPVQYGNCATETVPLFIVDGTTYGPGIDADTISVELGDTLIVSIVMSMDDSSDVSPPCDCDTAVAHGGDLEAPWRWRRTLMMKDPFPGGRQTLSNTSVAISSCPDTLIYSSDPVVFTRAGLGHVSGIGRIVWQSNILGPKADSVKVFVNVTSTPTDTGERAVILN
jgi:hypothetical protein